jgi:hypothetical protein
VQNATATEVSEVFTELEQKEALSDEVLKAAIRHPAADRGLGHLKEVIIQNSGLKDEIVEELADRQLPYSGAEINEMVQAQAKRSPYDQLQDQLTGAKTKRDIALQEGILYLLDSNNTKDALLLLGNEKGSFALRKKAEIYLAQKDWAKAQEYIDSFESADKGYGVLLQLSLAQQQAAKSMSELSDAQLQAVRTIAQNGNDKSQMQAKSLLLLNKGETYEEYNPKVPEEERAGKKETTEKPNPWLKMKAFDKTQLEITPKPANERASIKIQLDDIKEGVQLKIIDARGVEQRSYAIQDRYTSIEVDTKAFTSGIYICIVMQDSKILLKSTLNITH